MAIRPIRPFGDPVLRQRAQPVDRIDRALRHLVGDMIATMRDANGIGLAAPQVGVAARVIVTEVEEDEILVLFNPDIVAASAEMEMGDEGCLSLPGYIGAVERHAAVRVSGRDRRGGEQTIEADGLLARCLQHEIDHLDGILYTDRMKRGVPLRRDEPDDEAASA